MLRALSALISLDDADELSPAAREACHRDQVWAEREYVAAALNVERLAAYEANKALGRLEPRPVAQRQLAPVKRRRRRLKKPTNIIDIGDARAQARKGGV